MIERSKVADETTGLGGWSVRIVVVADPAYIYCRGRDHADHSAASQVKDADVSSKVVDAVTHAKVRVCCK